MFPGFKKSGPDKSKFPLDSQVVSFYLPKSAAGIASFQADMSAKFPQVGVEVEGSPFNYKVTIYAPKSVYAQVQAYITPVAQAYIKSKVSYPQG